VFIGEIIATLLLIPFVVWGAWTHPHRAFSWGMYSQSSKGFLWTDTDDITRVPSHWELQLDPASHFLTLPTLKRLLSETHPVIPLEGLIIGSAGGYRIHYDPEDRRLAITPLTPGTELTALHAELRRLISRQPPR
jgi:hypothetical protein